MLKRFKEIYPSAKKKLQDQFGYKNVHQIPKLIKISLNMSLSEAIVNSKVVNLASKELELISGQKPIITKAKKSISGFKLRQGMKIGCKVTLRRDRMYEFLERLVITTLPRVKEFRGFSKKNFDGKGNLNFGIKEQISFPEIDYNNIDKLRGLNLTIVTSTNKDEEAKKLLEEFYIPFYN